ncbi:Kunitz trypsin inhibitor 2 [Cardamine amara subsp. amara]|uniref:Kunitz trypsin inhibitor 2 n=1 Tax=Cardamine amara subsp. amara TaxID=228776 RepID=A0ABD1B774_CARAN
MSSLFPLVSFHITLLLAAFVCIQGQQTTVKDVDGNPVLIGKQYFIQPVSAGGPLVPTPLSISSFCPLGITLIPLPFVWGPPVTFANGWSASPKTIVDTSSDITIEFKSNTAWPVCNEFSKFWKVNDSSSEPAIVIGGRPSRPEESWFRIRSAGVNIYEFSSSAKSIGTAPRSWFGLPQLILTNDNAKTLFVTFKKLGDAITSTPRIEKLGLRTLAVN